MNGLAERQELIATVRKMNALGINQGTSGNASVRLGGGYLITPSGMAYDDLKPEDIVEMSFDGEVSGKRNPSSEWRFHHDLLAARSEFGAVVHTHGKGVMTLACQRMELPPFHYMIAVAGGNTIRCADYATFGTQELSDNALKAIEGRKACLLANHGLLAAEASLARALALAVEVETLCETYWRILQIGDPVLLTEAEMEEVRAQFTKGYGMPQGGK
ncbi:class II aldolase [Sneathiella chungangensis]|uniref:Class II aldolase n=1 Tax=Sneathiella chungangensis TaxID=1418234 RepID=A0A845MGL1_9PROT|nr:class II aldolase/adducin family protein [Sneathiella chungangensis]MZR22387.1 class II aldolase [Sneathiella chungangensis]